MAQYIRKCKLSVFLPNPSRAGKNILTSQGRCSFQYTEPHRAQYRVVTRAPKFITEQKPKKRQYPRSPCTPGLHILLLYVLNGTFLVEFDYEESLFFLSSSSNVTRTNTIFSIAQHCIALQFREKIFHQVDLFQSE